MDNATIRTAAYLAARERLDARKTTRNVQCNPPNIRCGNRCIPPNWDCRLKGQGTDPHLRAVKTDPLGGLANIQRGFARISKGIIKGNFSEVEGGKSAVIRGAVKIAPGNIQQKAELKKKLENRTAAIGMGLAVVTGGLGIHALLMKSNTFGYKYGLGKQINESVHTGISRVLDAAPLLGAQRARTRVGAFNSITEAVTRSARAPQAGPDGLVGGFESNSPETLRHLQNLNIGNTNRSSSSNLAAATKAVNESTRNSRSTNVYAWNEKHREAFWGAKVNAPDLDERVKDRKAVISVFARPAAEDFLVKQYNLPLEKGGSNASASAIKDALANKLIEEREMHVAYAKQLGLRIAKANKEEVIHPDDVNAYLKSLNKNAGITGSGTASKAVKDGADAHISGLMNGNSLSKRATDIYADTILGFDKLYGEVASKVKSVPGAASLSGPSKVAAPIPEGTQSLLTSLDRARVGEMARGLNLSRTQIAGDAHAELVRSAYFANRVVRSDKNNRATFAITDRVALNAASELAGRPITQPTEAFRVLQSEHGFSGVTRVRAASSTSAPTSSSTGPVPRTGLGRQAALSSLARDIRARAGNEGMSMEAAYRAAKRELEGRSDAHPELVRTATYLAARADFKEGKRLGKPCGASHIPKAHECRKGEGKGEPASTSDNKRKTATIAAVVGGALAIGIAGSVAYNLKTLSDPTKSPLDASPSIKDLVKSMKQEAGTKSASEAMGHYYTKKSGLKPGDVVYFRNEKDPAAHFGIYLGEGKDGVVRAVIANTNKSRFSWTDVAEIGATKPGIKTSQALMTPLMKAPAPKFDKTSAFSNEDVVRRAIRIAGTDYKFSLTRDNCEALANGIAYGVPESEQLQRFRRATRAVVDVGVSRGQRREAREAIYKGRARGRSYTAREFVSFLEGQREFSSPAGKELAKQYAQYFQNSRLDAAGASNGLISPDELWARIKSYGPALKAKAMADYLLIQRSLVEINTKDKRTDASKNGKPCGESHIPKNHKCNQGLQKAAKVALAAGAIAGAALLIKKSKVGEFHTGLMGGDLTPPYPKRRFGFMEKNQPPMSAAELAATLGGLKSAKGVIPENIDKLTGFIAKANIINDPKSFMADVRSGFGKEAGVSEAERNSLMAQLRIINAMGSLDGLASQYTNNIYVRSMRKDATKLQPDMNDVVESAGTFMDRRAKDQKPPVSSTEQFKQLFIVARNTKNGDTAETLNTIHEISHKVHFEASRRNGYSNFEMGNGKLYQPQLKDKQGRAISDSTLFQALYTASSEYGRSDIRGRRAETFSELSVLYMTQGERLRREHPIAYDWVDAIWKKAND